MIPDTPRANEPVAALATAGADVDAEAAIAPLVAGPRPELELDTFSVQPQSSILKVVASVTVYVEEP